MNIEINLKEIITEYSDIINLVDKLEISEEENISKLKVKLKLFDGTVVWLREVYLKGKLEVYSYYWLRPDESIIMGWDNAPHHKTVDSFPHHRHIGNKIESSFIRNIRDVFSYIRKFLYQA